MAVVNLNITASSMLLHNKKHDGEDENTNNANITLISYELRRNKSLSIGIQILAPLFFNIHEAALVKRTNTRVVRSRTSSMRVIVPDNNNNW